MAEFESWEQVVQQAALGDEEATSLMAQRMAQLDEITAEREQATQARGQAPQVPMYPANVVKDILEFDRAHPELQDPEASEAFNQYMTTIAQQRPDYTPLQRMQLAFQAVEHVLGPAETRGNSAAIKDMGRYRQHGRAASQLEIRDAEERPADRLGDPQEKEFEVGRSQDIAAMKAARACNGGGYVNAAAERHRRMMAESDAAYQRARRGPAYSTAGDED